MVNVCKLASHPQVIVEQEDVMAQIRPVQVSALLGLLLSAGALLGQSPSPANGTIQATGSAMLSVNPDQAQLTVGVVTTSATAQVAAQQNAAQTTAVTNALKSVLGAAGTIQTVGYSVSPNYKYPVTDTPVITGYTASNTIQVTTMDLSLPGPLIDAANQAGANNIGGLSFGLQHTDPIRQQALTQAAQQALAHAGAIATGFGKKTDAVVSAVEGSTVTPVVLSGAAASPTPTPVQTGQVTITATVTVTVYMQ